MSTPQTIIIDTETKEGPVNVEYEPYGLVLETDEILKTPAIPFDFSGELSSHEIAGRLKATIKKYNGLGLAAPQCGLPYQVFVAGFNETYYAFFNPKVLWESRETEHMEEGSLSFMGLLLGITRPKVIKLHFQDELGRIQIHDFDGLFARIILQNVDHLNGITFHEKAKPLALKSGLKRREKLFKKYARSLMFQNRIS